jgi:hypothetical protein
VNTDETFFEMMREEFVDAQAEHGPGFIPFLAGYWAGFIMGGIVIGLLVWRLT